MKMNFDFDIKNLNGDALKDAKANKVLADMVVKNNSGFDLLKGYDMALKIHHEGTIEIDRSDVEISKNIIIEDASGYIPLFRAQILSSILQQEK